MRQVEFDPDDVGRRFLLLTSGEERLVTGEEAVVDLPDDPSVVRWCRARLMSGPAEQSYAGYPVVVGQRERDGRSVRILGPLFFVPLAIRRKGEGYEAALEGSQPELNVYALDLLGIDREEREGLVSAVEDLEEIREADGPLRRVEAWVDVLREEGLIGGDFELRPDGLEPLPSEPGLSNTVILYSGERGVIVRHLVEELEELATRPVQELRRGPLGILLGREPCPEPVAAHPQPAILPSNLAQDEAITNALERPFTVVTGPPGTGKSQVLVNAIAAAMARGESVLFASKNNQAVDVVFQRLAEVSARAVPIRAGAARLRGEVAHRMQAALARPSEPPDQADAVAEWRAVAADLTSVYDQAALRARLEREGELRDAAYTEALQRAPTAVERIERPGPLLAALEEIRRLVGETARRPRFLPWAKARWRRAVARAEALWADLRRRLAEVVELPDRPEPDALERAGEFLRCAADVARARRQRDEVVEQLARVPERWDLEERLAAASDRRVSASRRLFEAAWTRCLGAAAPPARRAAQQLAEGLAALGRGERGSVRRLVKFVPDALKVFPIWGVTNLSAGANFPLQSELFDLVIIDEASQCDVPSAIPLLFRARRALIIGDPKQLIHVTSLRHSADENLARRWGLSDDEVDTYSYSRTSLFGLSSARVGGTPLFLDQHFRSRFAIIAFSNDHFYGSRLTVLTDETKGVPGPAVQWVDVPGRFARGPRGRSVVNLPEVQAVVGELGRLAEEVELGRTSVGVVTPYRAQAEAIRDRVARDIPGMADRLTVASAHRFQGDERDIIIFSPTVSREMPPYHKTFAGDPNLINVAITRARWRLIVVGDRAACLESPTVLAALARYIDDLTSRGFRSPCERELYDALVAARIPVRVGLQVDGRVLDLAVVTDDVKVDIEVDGAAYHRDARGDAIRDRQLQEAGWKVIRFSARDVRRNVAACVQRVQQLIEGNCA